MLKEKRAVFAGTARNCSWFLPDVLDNLSRLAIQYQSSAVVIAENDSDDATKSTLRSWLSRRSEAHLIELDGLSTVEPRRTPRIAAARNACLDHIRSSKYRDYDHLIMLDLDEVNAIPVSPEGFVAAANFLDHKPAIAGVFANQPMAYYDVWALRHPIWCRQDCFKQVAGRPHWMSLQMATILYVYGRQLSIPADARPIRVCSAFGGLGLYKLSSILDCRYQGLDPDGNEVCEHVSFNRQICDHSGELYIYPKLLNRSPREHLFDPTRFGRRDLLAMRAIKLCNRIFPPWKRYSSTGNCAPSLEAASVPGQV